MSKKAKEFKAQKCLTLIKNFGHIKFWPTVICFLCLILQAFYYLMICYLILSLFPNMKFYCQNSIGNPTVTRVVFFLNHINQRVGRVVLINHHEWREWNDRNEWWLIRTTRPTSWLMWFGKNTTSVRWDFWLIQVFKPWIITYIIK